MTIFSRNGNRFLWKIIVLVLMNDFTVLLPIISYKFPSSLYSAVSLFDICENIPNASLNLYHSSAFWPFHWKTFQLIDEFPAEHSSPPLLRSFEPISARPFLVFLPVVESGMSLSFPLALSNRWSWSGSRRVYRWGGFWWVWGLPGEW